MQTAVWCAGDADEQEQAEREAERAPSTEDANLGWQGSPAVVPPGSLLCVTLTAAALRHSIDTSVGKQLQHEGPGVQTLIAV